MIKRLILVLPLLIGISSIFAQDNYAALNNNLKWTFNIGSWIPVGNLTRTFNPALNFEFQYGKPVLDIFRVDIYSDTGVLDLVI